jgi:hypothetical protein
VREYLPGQGFNFLTQDENKNPDRSKTDFIFVPLKEIQQND